MQNEGLKNRNYKITLSKSVSHNLMAVYFSPSLHEEYLSAFPLRDKLFCYEGKPVSLQKVYLRHSYELAEIGNFLYVNLTETANLVECGILYLSEKH